MKKNRIVLFFLAACLLVGCKARKFDIQADMETAGFRAAESVQVQSEALEQPLTAEIKDGHFALSGKVNKSAFAKLNLLGGISRQGYPFILEPGHIDSFCYRDYEDILQRTQKCELPAFGRLPDSLEELPHSEMAAYVKGVLKEAQW